MHIDKTHSRGLGQTIGVMVVVTLASCLGLWHPSQAAEFTCADVACLIDAMNTANANGEENTIILEAGTYILTAVDNTTAGPTGLPSVTSIFPLTIRGAGAEATIIERQASAPDFRLVHVAATGALTLEELTLQGGQRSGGIFNSGGGIFNSGTLTVTNSILSGNSVTFGTGGGIENGGTLTVTNSTLSSNSATGNGGAGGGIRNFRSLTVINSTLSGNSATEDGGGIHNFFGESTIINSTLSGNSAIVPAPGQGGAGGGIRNSDATLTVINSTLSGNLATGFGGGGIANNGTLTVINSTLSGNLATRFNGGGILNFRSLTVINSTLSGNLATGFGGGIYNNDIDATALQNTIVALNTAPTGPDCFSSVTSQGHNLVGDPTDCTITLQASDLTGDPGLGDFTDNDTPGNGHFPLLPTSPAIDAGNDAVCPPQDQLGQPRVNIPDVGTSRCDIGAIEFQPRDTTPPVINVSVTPETLWPPNSKLVPVTVSGTITDVGVGVDPHTTAYAVEDEYGEVEPSGGPITLGEHGSYSFTIHLEASRRGNDRDGRHYTITVSAHDLAGNEGVGTASAIVPHDQRQ